MNDIMPFFIGRMLYKYSQRSVTEVPHTREHHGHTAFIGSSNYFGIAHRAARLNDAIGASVYHHIQAIAEREERIAGHNCVLQAQACMTGFDAGNAR